MNAREYPNNLLDKPELKYNKDINCFRKRKAFIAGAKYQSEQMYSESEIEAAFKTGLKIGYFSSVDAHYDELDLNDICSKWLKHFKKK